METGQIKVEVQPTYKVEQKVYNIGYTPTDEELTFRESVSALFYADNNAWIAQQWGDKLKFVDLDSAEKMFYMSSDKVPSNFVLTFGVNEAGVSLGDFAGNSTRTSLPTIKWPEVKHSVFCSNAFSFMNNIRELPDDYFGDKSYIPREGYNGNWYECHSLRHIPTSYFTAMQRGLNSEYNSSANWMASFTNSYWLDELTGVPVDYKNDFTSNRFNFNGGLSHLKDYIFATDNGQPYTAKWKRQTINLSYKTGYWNSGFMLDYFNSGITADKEVSDDATYQALKNNPDWYTLDKSYSRYNHDSALRTINSLPDCSAYVASGGTNTIIFEAEAGSKTDGGACGALTAEEIAIASAKGWTVSFV